jgi:hypothetical protein
MYGHRFALVYLEHNQHIPDPFACLLGEALRGIVAEQPLVARQGNSLKGVIIFDKKDSKPNTHGVCLRIT